MKQLINEAKRMQELAGIVTEMHLNEVDFKIGDIVNHESNEWKILAIFDTAYRLEMQPSPNVKSNVIKDEIKRENPKGPIKTEAIKK